MGDQLNQSQIDDLLKRLTGDSDEPVDDIERYDGRIVKEYNFNSPKKFTKEQLKILEDLHETFARVVATYFSGILRQYCEIGLVQIEEQLYYDFSSALPENSLIGLYELRPEKNQLDDLSVIMNFSTPVGFYLVERLLGGQGDTEPPDRAFTDLELTLLRSTFGKLTSNFVNAWSSYLECGCEFTGIETNSRLLQTLAPKEVVVVIMMELKINSLYIGNIDLCIPGSQLGDAINNFNNKYQKASSKRVASDVKEVKEKILANIVTSDVVVKAVLDELILDMQDILNLQIGDIIPLNKAIDSDIVINVDNVPYFEGKLGEVRQKKAVKLNHLLNQDSIMKKGDFYGG